MKWNGKVMNKFNGKNISEYIEICGISVFTANKEQFNLFGIYIPLRGRNKTEEQILNLWLKSLALHWAVEDAAPGLGESWLCTGQNQKLERTSQITRR